jgi:outer membrane protein assembly factor BamD (BamD/ComL family)
MKTIFLAFAVAYLAAYGSDDIAQTGAGSAQTAPVPGQTLTPGIKMAYAVTNAFNNAMASQAGPEADPQAFSKALQNEMGKIDLKAIGMNPPVTDADVEKLYKNLAGIKELFERAEAAFKAERYREAALGYNSVGLATVAGSEDCAAKARSRLIELESKARERLNLARDKDGIKANYAGAAKDLEFLLREFPGTAAGKQAVQEMASLRSRPAVAAYLDLEQGRIMLQQGHVTAALQQFHALVDNPRYRDTVAAFEARRQAQDLSDNAAVRELIGAETALNSERTAQSQLAQARNLMKNNMNVKASAVLKEIVELYPDTTSAAEAKRLLKDDK